MARRRGERIKVYVTLPGSRKYGYSTQETIVTKFATEVGITKFQGAAGVFFGANAPKPPRATFRDATGSTSLFCSSDKVSELKKKEGWSVTSKSRIRGIRTTGLTRSVYVDMPGGWKYAWNLTSAETEHTTILGISLATGNDASTLVWGVNDPKPPRASMVTATGSVSTFCEPKASTIEKALAAGWTVSGVSYDLLPDE